ncbi:hypothetical protein WAZ07_05760 [Bacillus sp. FJAT-51639]|uniref:Integrase n=1 Tax=Bacillus bruguierae TaxID=3127667 RepID=A0ABU8FGK0_9BACI
MSKMVNDYHGMEGVTKKRTKSVGNEFLYVFFKEMLFKVKNVRYNPSIK